MTPFGLPFSINLPPSPKLPISYSGYNSEANETTAATRPRKQTASRGSGRKLEILDSALVYKFTGGFSRLLVSRFPNSSTHPPNLPIAYTGYNSDTNETTATKRPRKQTGADGRPRKQTGAIKFSASLGLRVLGVFRTFWFPISHPPTHPELPTSYR